MAVMLSIDELARLAAKKAVEQLGETVALVVRCAECKRYVRLCEDSNASVCIMDGGLRNAKPEDFCSFGERKDGGK